MSSGCAADACKTNAKRTDEKAAADEAHRNGCQHMNDKGAQEEDENYKVDLGSRFDATLPQGHSAGKRQ
jgi:hypothetical protein